MADKNLTGLTPREAIADALHRCVLGLDSNNRDLFESACRKNENITVIAGAIKIEGWTAINNFFARVFAVVTTHTISNIRIELIDGADTAFMTAHAISYHVRPDDAFKSENASYTASSLYAIDLVKDGDDRLWKIKRWDIKVLWTTGDIAVLHGQDSKK
ncbi:hypothetical protein B0J11DRAFT_520067 [Dendryphion nanum]|uniref:SnoaL-like domain-containing protein n=1 Tax=Dendryphion nanum TaxID=256645 RepID=A0A9P9IZK6_9PLEO|nr:hypothetical protein B0J11DRAFT_520067 [Dendryphion nanum]